MPTPFGERSASTAARRVRAVPAGLVLAGALALQSTAGATAPPVDRGADVGDHHESAHAEPAGERLDFDEAIGLGTSSPGLVGLQETLRMRRSADEDLPTLSQNPQLQVMPGGRLPGAQEPGFELQAQLTQGWRLGGYGSKRKDAAQAETEALAAEVRAAQLERSLGAAAAWIDLHAAEARLAEANAALETDRQLLALLERARSAGAATAIEVAMAQTAVAEAQLAVTELQGEVHDLGLHLAREVGSKAPNPLHTRGEYPDPPLASEAEMREAFARLDSLPTVVQRRLDARAARARSVEERASTSTLLTTGVAYQRESNGDSMLFGLVGVQVPLWDRNQRSVAASELEAGRAEAQAEQMAVEAAAQLRVALHDLHHSEERLRTLREETLPAIDSQIAALERAVEMGEGTRISALRARHLRHVVAREFITAESRRVWARVEVWLYLQAIESAHGVDASAVEEIR